LSTGSFHKLWRLTLERNVIQTDGFRLTMVTPSTLPSFRKLCRISSQRIMTMTHTPGDNVVPNRGGGERNDERRGDKRLLQDGAWLVSIRV